MTRLGQNFLTSKPIARRMIEAAEIGPEDSVLEIGPGRGILTEELLKTGAKVIAIEKDAGMLDFLRQKFSSEEKSGKLVLIRADIRDIFNAKNDKIPTHGQPPELSMSANKIVANIPYYLTGQLLRLLLTQTKHAPNLAKGDGLGFGNELMVLMLQKEVALRITPHGQLRGLSKLGISVRVFAEPKISFFVSKGNFRPQPKVDSAVVVLKRRKKDFFREHKITQEKFFELVRAGFKHKRKFLKSNLGLSKAELLTECGVAENARAEDLSLENWACLAHKIK